MKKVLIYIFLTLLCSATFAQNQRVEKKAKLLTKFSFRLLNGGVMILKARFNNIKDTFNFILDTGSGGISLDSLTCEEYQIPHVPSGKTINGIAGSKQVDYAKNNSLHLPGLEVKNLDFYVNNYEVLSSVYGERIDGIIGYSFFSRYIVKINFDSIKIEVYEPGFMRYPAGGHLLKPLFTTLPIQPLNIKDERPILSNFYIDTGAGLSFLMSKAFAEDSAVLMKKRKLLPIQAEGMGGKTRMMITMIKELKLGPYKFKKVPAYILDDEYNATSYPFIGGLLGNDVLRRFNMIINYKKREIHIIPNKHYRDIFEYNYTGLSIYFIDGRIIIDDVVPDSPADKSNFKKDDIILAINNNFTNDINQYKDLMQSAEDKVKVLILRNNQPILINFKVGKIY
ncbi:MAG: aspartyl protease family protein [Ginsengibacter sp.]